MENKLLKAALLGTTLGITACANKIYTDDYSESKQKSTEIKQNITINKICQSTAPLLIIDHFTARQPDYGYKTIEHTIDIDGDSTPDIGHGDLVAKIAHLTGKEVISYGLAGSEDNMNGATISNAYSNKNSLTSIYRAGDFISRKVPDGIDINNDGHADFLTNELSNGPTIASQFNGLSVNTKGIKIDWRTENHKFYGQYIHRDSYISFKKTSTGTLIFDPAGNGDTTQVNLNTGTSFAAPNICGQ